MEIENIFLNSVSSTNDYAKKNYHNFNTDKLTCIFTRDQTGGYGSHNNKWFFTKEKDIAATFFFHMPAKNKYINCLGYLMAFTLCQVLIRHNLNPMIKWPNDILINGRKLSGILCETKEMGTIVFLGIGINVNSNTENLQQIDQPATSLKIETKYFWDIQKLQNELQDFFLKNLEIFKEKGFSFFHAQIEKLLAKKGDDITFIENNTKYKGKIHRITKEGYLSIILPSGEIKNIISQASIQNNHI
jgi:BirA family transcriptional regulator, biotin operon repressor / biotin---[acetyl-CoA-carboxylase] ligase